MTTTCGIDFISGMGLSSAQGIPGLTVAKKLAEQTEQESASDKGTVLPDGKKKEDADLADGDGGSKGNSARERITELARKNKASEEEIAELKASAIRMEDDHQRQLNEATEAANDPSRNLLRTLSTATVKAFDKMPKLNLMQPKVIEMLSQLPNPEVVASALVKDDAAQDQLALAQTPDQITVVFDILGGGGGDQGTRASPTPTDGKQGIPGGKSGSSEESDRQGYTEEATGLRASSDSFETGSVDKGAAT